VGIYLALLAMAGLGGYIDRKKSITWGYEGGEGEGRIKTEL